MYCKTRTYLNLKRLADRYYRKAMETQETEIWEYFEDMELECADYAEQYEDEIDWEKVNAEFN